MRLRMARRWRRICRRARLRVVRTYGYGADSARCVARRSPFCPVKPPCFLAFLYPLCQKEWVIYAKAPFRGPHHLLQYLARYTHRVAISNHRLIAFDGASVTFRWKDYAHGNKKRKMTISAYEFLRRFLLHTLPRGFVRIRFFGFMTHRRRTALLPLCRQLLGANSQTGL